MANECEDMETTVPTLQSLSSTAALATLETPSAAKATPFARTSRGPAVALSVAQMEPCSAEMLASVPHDCRQMSRTCTILNTKTIVDASKEKKVVTTGASDTAFRCLVSEITTGGYVRIANEGVPREYGPRVVSTSVMHDTPWYRKLKWMMTTKEAGEAFWGFLNLQMSQIPTIPVLPTPMVTPPLYVAFRELLDSHAKIKSRVPGVPAVSSTCDVAAGYRSIITAIVSHRCEAAKRLRAQAQELKEGNMGGEDEEGGEKAQRLEAALKIFEMRARHEEHTALSLQKRLAETDCNDIDNEMFAMLCSGKEFAYLRKKTYSYVKARKRAVARETDEDKESKVLEEIQVAEETAVSHKTEMSLEDQVVVGMGGASSVPPSAEPSARRVRKRRDSSSSDDAEDTSAAKGATGARFSADPKQNERTNNYVQDRVTKAHNEKHRNTIVSLTALSHAIMTRYLCSLEFLLWELLVSPPKAEDLVLIEQEKIPDPQVPGDAITSNMLCFTGDMPVESQNSMQQYLITAARNRIRLRPTHTKMVSDAAKPTEKQKIAMATDPSRINPADLEALRDDPSFFLAMSWTRFAVNPNSEENRAEMLQAVREYEAHMDSIATDEDFYKAVPLQDDPNEPNYIPDAEARKEMQERIDAQKKKNAATAVGIGRFGNTTVKDDDMAYMAEMMGNMQLREEEVELKTGVKTSGWRTEVREETPAAAAAAAAATTADVPTSTRRDADMGEAGSSV